MNWRLLLLGVEAFVVDKNGEKVIYLTSLDEKDDIDLVKLLKKRGCNYNLIKLDSEPKFKLKLVNTFCDISVYIKSDKLGDSWYELMNFNNEHLATIIEQNKINYGEIEEEFEAIFNKKDATVISFVSPNMQEYKDYSEERSRIINCKIYSKTKKVVIGHRYDSLTETRYYIGKVNSRKTCNSSSVFCNDESSLTPAYLYVTNLKNTDKSIEDIFKTRVFGSDDNCIKVDFEKVPSMVDSGESLICNANKDISTYWDILLNNSIEKCKKITKEGYEYIENYECILDLFSYQTTNFNYNISSSMKSCLEKCISDILKHLTLLFWNKIGYRNDLSIGRSNSNDENIKALIKLFYENLESENVMRNLYYKDILDKLGINIKDLATSIINNWDICSELYKDFDSYYKHLFYIKKNKLGEEELNFNDKSKKTLKDLYVDSHLRNEIVELVNSAKLNYGIGVNDYKKSAEGIITCKVTIDDILHKYNNELPDELKKDIVDLKFNSIVLIFNEKTKIE